MTELSIRVLTIIHPVPHRYFVRFLSLTQPAFVLVASNDVVKVEIWDVVDIAVKGVKKMTSLKLSDEEAQEAGGPSRTLFAARES
jgi:hypothetical protein